MAVEPLVYYQCTTRNDPSPHPHQRSRRTVKQTSEGCQGDTRTLEMTPGFPLEPLGGFTTPRDHTIAVDFDEGPVMIRLP